MSGTIVERRDQVFTTFFSLRVFSASTLSRKWPSTNGPFFVERAIASLFLHAPQSPPLGVPHLLETPHRTGNTMRLRTERANKTRAQSIGCPIHNPPPSRPCTACTAPARVVRQLSLRAWQPLSPPVVLLLASQAAPCVLLRVSNVYVLLAFSALPSRPCQRQPGTAFAVLLTLGALVQDCAPSLQPVVSYKF